MDTSALEAIVDEVIAANPDTWAKFAGGEAKAGGFLTGQVMKATNGQADGRAVNGILQERKGAAAR
jgi:aspartyl-tRNA(Asn)/glutamyl-tRNA(Gln) amidotransferase subunit B